MRLLSWQQERISVGHSDRPRQARWRMAKSRPAVRSRPHLESLEERALLSGVSFSSAVSYGVGTRPVSTAVGDLNGDGKLDLAVANAFSNSVSVLLGNGDGTFQAAQTLRRRQAMPTCRRGGRLQRRRQARPGL